MAGRAWGFMNTPSVHAADELPVTVAPVEGEVEDPARRRRRPCRPRPATAPARRAGRGRGRRRRRAGSSEPTTACTPDGLPPGPGLHPVRDHRTHLPQASAPQELLGPLDAVTMPLRTSTGSSYRLTCPASPSVHRPLPPRPLPRTHRGRTGGPAARRRRGSRSSPPSRIEHLFEQRERYTSPPTTRQDPPSGGPEAGLEGGQDAGQPSSSSASSAPRRNSLVSGCQRKRRPRCRAVQPPTATARTGRAGPGGTARPSRTGRTPPARSGTAGPTGDPPGRTRAARRPAART